MSKRPLNEALFSIQGVNPGLNTREELNTISLQQTTGKVICERLTFVYYYLNNNNIRFL
jgi:hypothetical protein